MAVRLESMPKSGVLPGLQRAVNAYQNPSEITLGIFGRTCGEAIAEFSSFINSLQTSRHGNATPSLIDSDYSPPSSPDWSPTLLTHAISVGTSPPASPAGSSMSKIVHETSILMQDEEDLTLATQAMDIQADHFPVMHEPAIHEEEPSAPIMHDIAVQEVEAAIPTPRTSPLAPVAQLSTLMDPATSMQQILDVIMAPQRSPMALESIDSSPAIMVVEPPRDEDDDEEDVAVPAHRATLPPDGEASLSPRQVHGRFRCPQCPDTAPRTFTRQFDMTRHIKSKHQERTRENLRALTCPSCYVTLSRPDAFRRHILRVPASCLRNSRLKKQSTPPPQPESLYELCRAGNPPLPDRMSNSLES